MTAFAGDAPLLPLLLVAAAAFLGSVASAITGAGGAIIIAFALAPLIGVGALVQTVSVAMAVSHAARIGAFRDAVDWRIAGLLLAAAIPGCVLGALAYAQLNERAIALVLGCFMLCVVAIRRLRPMHGFRLGRRQVAACAFVYGVATGATIGGGILALPILASAGLAGAALVATDAVVGLALHGVKIAVFGGAAVLTPDLALFGLLVGMMTIPGAWAARWLLGRIPLKVHALIMDGVIAAGGIGFLAQAR